MQQQIHNQLSSYIYKFKYPDCLYGWLFFAVFSYLTFFSITQNAECVYLTADRPQFDRSPAIGLLLQYDLIISFY